MVQALNDGGSLLAAALNASMLALVNSGIQCRAMLAVRSIGRFGVLRLRRLFYFFRPQAVSIAVAEDGKLLIDPTIEEEKARTEPCFSYGQ